MRDIRLLHARELLELHDAGHFGMPAEILAARATLQAMKAAETETGATWEAVRPGDVEQRLAEEMLDAGVSPKAGALAAVVKSIDDAERKQRAAEMAVRVARLAVEMAELRFVSAVDEHRDELIVDHLRPALRETLEEVRGLAELLEGSNLRDPLPLLGDAKRGAAYQALVAAMTRQSAIRDGQRHCAGGNLPDPWELAVYRNAPAAFARAGLNWKTRRQFGKAPWPEHPLERLRWEATDPDAEPWIPLRAEFEQLAEEVAATSRLRPAPTIVG